MKTPETYDDHPDWTLDQLQANRHALYLARLARVREFMAKAGAPAVLILDPNNIFYATGARNMQLFGLRSASRFLLIIAGGPSILFEYFGCEHLAQGLPTIDEIRPAMGLDKISSGDAVEATNALFADEIHEILSAFDPTIDRIAIDRMPLYSIDALRAKAFHLMDAADVFVPSRAIKLPVELPYMREAMARVHTAVQRLEDHIRPGLTESEAWAEFHYAFMAKEGQYVSTRLFQSGPNTYPYFQEADTRVLEQGDLLCLDTDALGYEGYAVDFSRTFLCGTGKASDPQRYLYEKARSQLETNAELLAPGLAFEEFAQHAWKIPPEHQQSRYYCIGHGLGMAGEFPNIPHHAPGEPYSLPGHLEPGMVICLESYVGSAGFGQGVKLEDQFLILDDGVERMSGYRFDDRLG